MKLMTLTLGVFLAITTVYSASAQDAVVTDSRIKTLVYSANDVFSLLTVYGYQSNIEFSDKEEIQTVSVGDRVGWQIVASGNRLFIRPQEFGAHTNMSVITNKRSYQFDLKSAQDENLPESEELVYVVRFFYPEETNPTAPVAATIAPPSILAPTPITTTNTSPSVPAMSAPQPSQSVASEALPAIPSTASPFTAQNYNYTYTGSLDYAPTRIYDDGISTYVTLPKRFSAHAGDISFISGTQSVPKETISSTMLPEGVFVLNKVTDSFAIKYKDGTAIQVFNESHKIN